MPINPAIRTVTAAEFAVSPLAEQLDLLRGLDPRQKTRLLIEAPNGAELMAQLPAQDVYLLAVERGPEHLPELLSLATPEQWTAFVDLDCWEGDRFDALKARRWLATLLEGEEPEVCVILRTMNFEQLVLLVHSEVTVLSGPESIEDDDARAEAVRRDGGYELDYRDEVAAKLYGQIFDILYRHEHDLFLYLIEAARAETLGLIEESVYQQRLDRLCDMGIPTPDDAARVYAWLDPETWCANPPHRLAPGLPGDFAPAFMLTLKRPKGLLAEVLAGGVGEPLAWELAVLVNKVLVADRVAPGEIEEVGQAIARVDAFLNLALAWLAGDDVAVARQTLNDSRCEDLFRIGYSLVLRLKRRAGLLRRSPITPYLDEPLGDFLTALDRRVPLCYEGLDSLERTGTRLFEHPRDLERAGSWLELIEIQQALFVDHFGFDLPEPSRETLPEGTTLADLFLTALANRLLGRPFAPQPLAVEEVVGLHGMVAEGGRVRPALRVETKRWLESLVSGGGRFADYCLDLWEDEFCAVAAEALDPRYVGGLILADED